jgi:hypothetical protein
MIRLVYVITISILVLAFGACRKENCFPNTTIKGTVIDSTTNIGVRDVVIKLITLKYSSLNFVNPSRKAVEIRSVITDENGDYEFKFRQVRNRNYKLSFSKESYQPLSHLIGKDFVPIPEFIELIPIGTITLNVVDNPSIDFDKVFFRAVNSGGRAHICSENLPATRTIQAVGNSFNQIEWTYYVNSGCVEGGVDVSAIQTTFTDSIWVPHNGSNNYLLEL